MKKLLAIIALLALGLSVMAQRQEINIGTAANDGTGDNLRAAFEKVNDNFTELYARMGPIAGQKYEALILAIKYFEVNENNGGGLFYISELKSKITNGASFDYSIEITKTTSLDEYGDVVMLYAITSAAKTGLELVILPEYDGSGVFGVMVINWSELPAATTYQCTSWEDGGIFTANIMSPRSAFVDGAVQVVTTADTLDGAKQLYIFDPVDDIDVMIQNWDSVVGVINLKNISSHLIDIIPKGTETIDNISDGVRLSPGKSMSIMPYDSNFVVSAGIYDTIPAP